MPLQALRIVRNSRTTFALVEVRLAHLTIHSHKSPQTTQQKVMQTSHQYSCVTLRFQRGTTDQTRHYYWYTNCRQLGAMASIWLYTHTERAHLVHQNSSAYNASLLQTWMFFPWALSFAIAFCLYQAGKFFSHVAVIHSDLPIYAVLLLP